MCTSKTFIYKMAMASPDDAAAEENRRRNCGRKTKMACALPRLSRLKDI
jgi:hypothetical protein